MKKKDMYYKFELNMVLANIIAVVEFIILVVLNEIFMVIDFSNISFLLIFIAIIFYTAIHELLHGIAFSLFTKDKKSIKYGVLLEKGVFYAACQSEINKKGIIISLLFPTIFLTILPLPFAHYFDLDVLLICVVYNFIGAIGDLMMTYFALHLPKNTRYIDYDITVGATFIANESLEQYSSKIMKLIDSGEHKRGNIDKSIKRFNITKTSIIFLLILLLISIISVI